MTTRSLTDFVQFCNYRIDPSLTDIARYKNTDYPSEVIQNWMRNRSTVEFLGLWERIHNPNFNYLEFEVIDREAGRNAFVLTPKRWIEAVGAVGITSKQGRYAATFAHKDIAFKFASWISAESKLYIIKDYQRLKTDENSRISINWNVNRIFAKVNYKIHTDAIKDNLIPPELTPRQKSNVYANEADLLNTVLFGTSAYEWRKKNPDKDDNIRDYATIEQLLVLANIENINALFIEQGMPQVERMDALYSIAKSQMEAIVRTKGLASLKTLNDKGKIVTNKGEQSNG
ncbi:MAG: KilA-N domain-containing protein [Firmicutes bacterium]|nr:KilA-N domain-containing protein [Bacillota bacterium]